MSDTPEIKAICNCGEHLPPEWSGSYICKCGNNHYLLDGNVVWNNNNSTNPDHYKVGKYEAIDILESKLTEEEFQGFLKGNIMKYMMRSNYKGQHDTDCAKAAWYANKLEEVLNGRES